MNERPPVFISAPIATLVEGIYRADTTIGDPRARDNHGLGTFNDLGGEIIPIDGKFSAIRARSAPKRRNYIPLAEVAKVQTIFDFKDVEGSLVGFLTPSPP